MSKRIILNETSYFGKGAIKEIVNELKGRHLQKILVVTGENLLKFGIATKVTDLILKFLQILSLILQLIMLKVALSPVKSLMLKLL